MNSVQASGFFNEPGSLKNPEACTLFIFQRYPQPPHLGDMNLAILWHKPIFGTFLVVTASTRGSVSENSTVMLRAIIGTVFVFLRPPLTSPTADLAVLEGLDKVFLTG